MAGTTGPSQPADDQRANYDIENVEGANNNTFGDVEDGVMSIGGGFPSMIGLRHKHVDKQTFSTFGHPVEAEASSMPIVDNTPWQPFTCCTDFKFAELAHQAALNKDQTDKMLQLIWQITEGQAKFTFRSHTELLMAWDRAATQMMTFEKHVISVPYKKEEIKFNSSLLNNGVPFTFILYTNKTHLTSSGHVKAYPVIACCANLPIHIRNNDGIGGGCVVGWLLIVPTDSNEDEKLNYTNMKCVVWHKAFIKLLESIILYSKTGFAHRCFDAIMRWLYPLILLLSADYKERHKAFLELYLRDRITGEEVLKAHGLCPIANALWEVNNSDPHEMLSFDPLNVNDIGNWGNHLFGELKVRVKALGHKAEAKIDKHNGNKLRDIVKAYIDIQGEHLTKNWNFPKVHALTHAFPNICMKGVVCNFSTRLNEKQHGPLKQAYLCQTNCKDVANQLYFLPLSKLFLWHFD
ncbi:hypothetical protein BD769DRAFT_1386961 [Suillus cothurnatus]|nr:hypothetical protein BD769DRAFT_1386961 [Suillus cothurnatus]